MANKATPKAISLTAAQQRQLTRLVNDLTATSNAQALAQAALDAAQQQSALAQGHANMFLDYCAEEHGIVGEVERWEFRQNEMRWVWRNEEMNGGDSNGTD